MVLKSLQSKILKQVKTDLQNDEVSDITLPKANVIKIYFNEGFIALRPSGTEPKIKLYVSLSVTILT